MILSVNGKTREVPDGTRLGELLLQFSLRPERVVASVNGELITPGDYETCHLKEGDKLDLLSFVGGG